MLTTADGVQLEAEVSPTSGLSGPSESLDTAPVAVAAVVCHPHPLYGGTMHNNVVFRLFGDLSARRIPTVRFNFRGVGQSGGSHGAGRDERADVVAAIDFLATDHPERSVLLCGYSFGADVALAVDDERIGGWLAVSPPLRTFEPDQLVAGADSRPKILVSGSNDEIRSADQVADAVATWPSTSIQVADGVDHFWMSGLGQITAAVDAMVDQLTSG